MFVLDTNVISEPTAKQPEPLVMAWLTAQQSDTLYLASVTLGELRRGILLLDAGRKKRGLLEWLENEIKPAFAGRVLDVDSVVMERWADLAAAAKKQGRDARSFDLVIAAIALVHDYTLATRNIADFTATGAHLVNPWAA